MSWNKLYTIQYGEKPISSTKYNAEIDNIYEKLNLLKITNASPTAPTDIEVGQLWYDTSTGILKLYTSNGFINILSELDLANIKETNVKDDTNPIFLTIDGTRQLSLSYTPTNTQDIATKGYVDLQITNLSFVESQIRDDMNPIFLTIDGTRQLSLSYTPTNTQDIATKGYVDNALSNIPVNVVESDVRDDTNPVFLTIDGSRQLDGAYVPTNPQDIATKDYVDTQITTGGVGTIGAGYVTYSPDTTTPPTNWSDLTEVQTALDKTHLWLQDLDNVKGKVLVNDTDTIPDYLINKFDNTKFILDGAVITIASNSITNAEISSGTATANQVLMADGLGNTFWGDVSTSDEKVKLNVTDTTAGYLEDKLDLNQFENTGAVMSIKNQGIVISKLNTLDSTQAGQLLITDGNGNVVYSNVDNITLEYDSINNKYQIKSDSITDNHININAGISWSKISKTGSSLNDLGDVNINTPSDGEILVYNSTTAMWENKPNVVDSGEITYLSLFLR